MSVGPSLDPSRRSGGGQPRPGQPGPIDPSIRRTWWLLAGSFLFLGLIALARVALERSALDWLVVIAVALAAIAAVGHRNAVARLEARRRAEAESYARILRGLSRSVSADSIVEAIMGDLVDATGADHVAIVRRRADGTALDATLVTGRPGIPPTTTPLPMADLEGPFGPVAPPAPIAVPIESDRPAELVAAGSATAGASATAAASATSAASGASAGSHEVPDAGFEHAAGAVGHGRGVGDGRARLDLRPAWLADPPGGLRSARVRAAGVHARRGAAVLGRELLALVRDLGVPAPDPARPSTGPAIGEVLATGLDAAATERIANRVRGSFGLSQTIAAPIRTEQGLIGAIVLSRRDRAPWSDSARRLLFGAARETATALERATTLRAAEAQATTDALTGLPNRRYFEEFSGLLARRRRSGDAVAALMIDIDHFKRLNEAHGHPVGDAVLRRVAQAIATTVREEDVPARVGGEEFAVLLRNPGPTVAAEVGERVRLAVRGLDLRDVGVEAVSVSVGVANARGPDEPIPALVERADQALRKAKRSGRDQVVTAG